MAAGVLILLWRREKPQVTPIAWGAADMMVKYKETARGGLAVNVIEC